METKLHTSVQLRSK